jgi:prepilin peptidase CpaA
MPITQLLDQILFLVFFATIIFAALSDLSKYRIPNAVSLALVLLFPLHVLASPVHVDWIGSLAVAGAVFLAGFVLFAGGLVGGGDVKLLAATALWAGQALVLPQLAVMAMAGGLLSLVILLLQFARRFLAGGLFGLFVPDLDAPAPKVPYGLAIAAGAGYAGLKVMAAGLTGTGI